MQDEISVASNFKALESLIKEQITNPKHKIGIHSIGQENQLQLVKLIISHMANYTWTMRI